MSAALEQFAGNELRVIGFTASSEYNDERKLSMLLQAKICEIHVRDLVDIGILSAVQLLAVATDAEVHTRGAKGDFTERELRPLMFDRVATIR